RAVVRTGTVTIYDDAVVPGKRSRAVIGPLDATFAGGGDGGETRIDLSIGLGGSRLAAEGRLTARDGGATLEAQARASPVRAGDVTSLGRPSSGEFPATRDRHRADLAEARFQRDPRGLPPGGPRERAGRIRRQAGSAAGRPAGSGQRARHPVGGRRALSDVRSVAGPRHPELRAERAGAEGDAGRVLRWHLDRHGERRRGGGPP